MDVEKVSNFIADWLKTQVKGMCLNGFIVGVSRGIDSAVVSSLCGRTDLPTKALSLPILQSNVESMCAEEQSNWLTDNFENISGYAANLTNVFL